MLSRGIVVHWSLLHVRETYLNRVSRTISAREIGWPPDLRQTLSQLVTNSAIPANQLAGPLTRTGDERDSAY